MSKENSKNSKFNIEIFWSTIYIKTLNLHQNIHILDISCRLFFICLPFPSCKCMYIQAVHAHACKLVLFMIYQHSTKTV